MGHALYVPWRKCSRTIPDVWRTRCTTQGKTDKVLHRTVGRQATVSHENILLCERVDFHTYLVLASAMVTLSFTRCNTESASISLMGVAIAGTLMSALEEFPAAMRSVLDRL